MDQEMKEMFGMLFEKFDQMDQQIKEVKSDVTQVRHEIKETETRIMVKIENDVTKRIDALVDGYKLNHEKQWELEQQVKELERRVDRLEITA